MARSEAPSSIWEELAQALRTENKKLQGQLSEIAPDPTNADLTEPHQTAALERSEDNYADALTALRDGFEILCSPLQESCLALARYHLSLYPDRDEALHLREAERLARTAALLRPDDRVATTLTIEIQEVMAAKNIGFDQREPGASSLYEYSNAGHRGAGTAAERLVRVLIERAQKHFAAGQYLIQEQLANRARLLGLFELGKDAPATLQARYQHLLALDCLGRYQAALRQTNHLLPDQERVLGAEHPDTLTTRLRRVKILDDLGESENAHQAVEDLIPVQVRVLGAEHPDTLTTRFRRATILNSLGEHEAAREALEQLLAIRQSQPDTLTQRYLKATMILNDFGRYRIVHRKEAPQQPAHKHRRGPIVPDTLIMRSRKAEILANYGELEAAREEVEHIIPVQESASGPEHPDTLATRSLKARILAEMGERYAARMEIDLLLPIQERVLGAHHRLTQMTCRLKKELTEER